MLCVMGVRAIVRDEEIGQMSIRVNKSCTITAIVQELDKQ